MKKIKLLILITALTLTTVGVFAGKKRFAPNGIYAFTGSIYCTLSTTISLSCLLTLTPTGNQAAITDGMTTYYLFSFESTTSSYEVIYANF